MGDWHVVAKDIVYCLKAGTDGAQKFAPVFDGMPSFVTGIERIKSEMLFFND